MLPNLVTLFIRWTSGNSLSIFNKNWFCISDHTTLLKAGLGETSALMKHCLEAQSINWATITETGLI